MPPAARVTDMHTCPMVTALVPHVGGPILPPGCPTVLIGMMPAAGYGFRPGGSRVWVGRNLRVKFNDSTVLLEAVGRSIEKPSIKGDATR